MARSKRGRHGLLFLVFGVSMFAPGSMSELLIGCLIVGGSAAFLLVAPLVPELLQRLFTGAIALRVPDEEVAVEAELCPEDAGRRHEGSFHLPECVRPAPALTARSRAGSLSQTRPGTPA